MWRAYNDKVIILLTVAAVISLALGIYETVGKAHGGVDVRITPSGVTERHAS